MISKIAGFTDKTILFCYAYAGRVTAFNFPWMQAKIKPSLSVINKIMFDIHPYPPYYVVMLYFRLISKLMKTNPLFVGEYNYGTGNDAAISLSQHKRYLKTFKKFFPYGVIFWQWSYKIDNGHHAFNLTKTVDGKIVPNDNFENLAKAMEEVMV